MNEENMTSETIIQAKAKPQTVNVSADIKNPYSMGKGMKFVFYMLSFLIFPGIVFGAVFYSKDDPEFRHVGRNCIFIALFPLLFYLFIIIITVSFGIGNSFMDGIKDVPY